MFGLSPKEAAGLTGWYLLFQIGLFVPVAVVRGIGDAITGQQSIAGGVNPAALILVNSAAAFLVLRRQLRRSQLPLRGLFRPATRWVGFLPGMLLLMLGECILASEVSNWMVAVLPPPQSFRDYAKPLHDLATHPFSAPFMLIVVAAVTEEFVFRGLILRGLLARIRPGRAIAISAGLFAVMHLNPWQLSTAFFIGVILGWVYLRTRSLALCIAGHGFHNAMSLLAAGLPFTVAGFNQDHAPEVVLFQPWWFNLLGVALLCGGGYWLRRIAPAIVWTVSTPLSEPPLLPCNATTAAEPEETPVT